MRAAVTAATIRESTAAAVIQNTRRREGGPAMTGAAGSGPEMAASSIARLRQTIFPFSHDLHSMGRKGPGRPAARGNDRENDSLRATIAVATFVMKRRVAEK